MKAILKYQNAKKVKVIELILSRSEFITKPILSQVKIEWKDDQGTWTDIVDANQIEFV
jgi:hypothetical protein